MGILSLQTHLCNYLSLQKDVNATNAMKISQDLKKLSQVNPKKTQTAEDINNIATILEKIAAVKEKTNEVSYNWAKSFEYSLELNFDEILPFSSEK